MPVKPYLIATTALAIFTGWVGQGGFVHQVGVLVIGVYVWLPIFLLTALLALVGWRKREWRPWLLKSWGILGVVALGLFVSFAVGELVYRRQHNRVVAFVERAQIELDAERARTGRYPATLPPSLAADLPPWLNHHGSYQVVGDDFQFNYSGPGAFMFGDQTYDSSVRRWESLD